MPGLRSEEGVDDLQIIFDAMIDFAKQNIALLERAGALFQRLGQMGVGVSELGGLIVDPALQIAVCSSYSPLAIFQQFGGVLLLDNIGLQLRVEAFQIGRR